MTVMKLNTFLWRKPLKFLGIVRTSKRVDHFLKLNDKTKLNENKHCINLCILHRPAVEELVKSKFNSVNNLAITAPTQKMPTNRPVIGGSALALNKINEQPPMPRNASSVVDLVNATGAKNGDKELTQTSANNKRLADELKQINNTNTEPATIRSKFTPGNIFKNFFK